MKLEEIIRIIERKYPLSLAENWDNVGLMVGDETKEVQKVLVSIEANEAIIEEAIKEKADLIVTHHPFLFRPLKRVVGSDLKGRLIQKLITHGIAIYSMHTNFDVAEDGLNDYFMKCMGFSNAKVLSTTQKETLYKFIVYVPESHVEQVRTAITNAGAGKFGTYQDCTFEGNGIGRFLPLEGSNPFLGTVGITEEAKEVRIECTVKEAFIEQVVAAMKEAHPYEMPAYDVIKLTNCGKVDGIGRIAKLEETTTVLKVAEKIKKVLNMPAIRVIGDLNQTVTTVAVVTGSGADYIMEAKKKGAELFLTGDVKYHEAQDAIDAKMCVIDCNHFESENIFKDVMGEFLTKQLTIPVQKSEINLNPITIL